MDYTRVFNVEVEMKKIVFVFFFLFILFLPQTILASENQFVTIVNPVRIAPYTNDSAKSIAAEYNVIKNSSLPATWLLTYDVLQNTDAVAAVKHMDKNQEVGLFLEVGSSLCTRAEVLCNEG